ncbi:MAG: hypothetical protein LBH43_20615 [Treponema sp.]|nr:hypothetical protein [Treponema sp.]
MKNAFRFIGFALAALFIFTMTACDSGPSGGGRLTGEVTIPWFVKEGGNLEADITGLNVSEGLAYQWQWSEYTGAYANFKDITGENGATYNNVTVPSGYFIRLVVTGPAAYAGTVTSNVVKVQYNSGSSAPVITGITITPPEPPVNKGGKFFIGVLVTGTVGEAAIGEYDYQDVTWSVSGNKKPGTFIENEYHGANLYVAPDETASSITVKAVSMDPSISDQITVNLAAPLGRLVKITGLPVKSGIGAIQVSSSLDDSEDGEDGVSVSGSNYIDNGALTVSLFVYGEVDEGIWGDVPWDGSGSFYIVLIINDFDVYLYTNGQAIDLENPEAIQKCGINSATTTIAFNKFKAVPFGQGGRQLTITGINSQFNQKKAMAELYVRVWIEGEFDGYYDEQRVAAGHAAISGGNAVITLCKGGINELAGWKDGGECYIKLFIIVDNNWEPYVYTNGQTLEQLGITWLGNFWTKAPKYNFNSDSSTISFGKFAPSGELDYIDPDGGGGGFPPIIP